MENLMFKDLNVSKEVQKAIEEMGFEEATPIQSQSIPLILEGLDVTAQAPTGSGKTCAFGIPIVDKIDTNNQNIQALVLCPTRELVIQSTDELTKLAAHKKNVVIVPIYGGQQIDRQIMALRKHPQIIVATPGRLMDHMRRKTLKIDNLRTLVLDEADEMLNMGFREDLDVILETAPKERHTVLFSATLSKDILFIANKYQKNSTQIKVQHKQLTVPTISQYYIDVKGPQKIDVLTRIIDTTNYKLSLIFCNTKKKVDELTDELCARGYFAEALHGDLKQIQRDRVMSRFKKGSVDILVATDVAARGIDIDDIEAVFNYDVPSDEEYYVHRIGRTARAGRVGVAYTFASGKEMYKIRDIMRYTKATIIPMKAPSVADVEELEIKSVLDEAVATIEKGKLTKFVDYIDRLTTDNNDITTIDCAAALLFMSLKQKPRPEAVPRPAAQSRKTGAERGMIRLFVSAGNMDRLQPGHLVGIIANNTSVTGDQIGVIDIFDKFSFVEVPAGNAEEVINALCNEQFKGRNLIAQQAKEKSPDKKIKAKKSKSGF